MMESKVMVSVICMVYNHEKYIRECIDGFIKQETTFKFEVLIHDDASTDKTAEIIREYEKKYPEVIKPIYQTENQYSKNVQMTKEYILPLVKGKYIALCEGDDFWVDPNKLQKQFDAMEQHSDCRLCVHAVKLYEENGTPMNMTMPKLLGEEGVISSRVFLRDIALEYCYQTITYFFRTDDIRTFWYDVPEFKRVARTGDYPYMLFFAQLGNVYYLNQIMAGHRMESVSSWTKNFIAKRENVVPHWEREVKMFEAFDRYTHHQYADICQLAIKRVTYEKYMRMQKYRKVIYPKYWIFLRKSSVNMRIYIVLNVIFPKLMQAVYLKYREGKNGIKE